jgi:WhiB family redox-sensing transcriptional regulator
VTSDTTWMADANCLGLDPDLFHPHKGEWQKAQAAVAVCAGCEVRTSCLDYALSLPPSQVHGVWGGTTEEERRRVRRQRQRLARQERMSA